MKFGAQVSCYLTTWDDIRAVVEMIEAGVDEVMFGRLPNQPEEFQRIEEEVIAAFD